VVERGLGLFMEVKRLFFTTPETEIFSKSSWIETEANGGHWGDRTLNQTWSQNQRGAGAVSLTGASGRSRDRRVRSSPRETAKSARSIGRC
jgi:hypothetical protein